MKVKPGMLDPLAWPRTPGTAVLVQTKTGMYFRSWPSPKKNGRTPQEKFLSRQFALAGRMAANPIDIDYGTAVEMAKGTTMVPRDILTTAAYGKYYRVQGTDGYVWPVADHSVPVGGPPPPPDTGETMFLPIISAPEANANTQAHASATKGLWFNLYVPIKLTGVLVTYPTTISGQTQRLTLGHFVNGNELGDIIAVTEQSVTWDANRSAYFPIQAELEADAPYCLILTRTDDVDGYSLPMWLITRASPIPMRTSQYIRRATNDPTTGTDFIVETTWRGVGFSLYAS